MKLNIVKKTLLTEILTLIQFVFGCFLWGGRREGVRQSRRPKSALPLQEDIVEPYQDLQNCVYSYCIL